MIQITPPTKKARPDDLACVTARQLRSQLPHKRKRALARRVLVLNSPTGTDGGGHDTAKPT